MRRFVTPTLMMVLAAAALTLPGGAEPAQAAKEQVIRVALLAPRNSGRAQALKRINKDLRDATDNKVGLRIYPSGVAGDEKDYIRKMKVGQLDAAILTATGLGQIHREVVVLNAPGVVNDYKQFDALTKTMRPRFEKKFDEKGFKLISWGSLGEYRLFSKKPIDHPNDIKQMRPWLWPESYVLRELWSTLGATGVPLGVPEVYGALQTDMVDMVTSTGISITALQWHTKLDYLTKNTSGVLLVGLVVSNKKWNALPEDGRQALLKIAQAEQKEANVKNRTDDKKAIVRLLKRGFKATSFTEEGVKANQRWRAKVTKRLTGRVFSKQLLEEAKAIAAKAK